ncbi:ATP-dependent zinc protease [Marinobacteraceae bacterium S3BR75-40.1]
MSDNRTAPGRGQNGSEPALWLGWREWLALPQLGIDRIKAKVDTGARTSCLHTFKLESFSEGGAPWVRFWVHPKQNNDEIVVVCEAPMIDQRMVSDSGGHREERYVIQTDVVLGKHQWPVEMTLTNRDSMRFRMLLGRTAMAGTCCIDPEASYLSGKPQLAKEVVQTR